MSYPVGEYYDKFIQGLVDAGRFKDASEVVREGLRLVEAREEKTRMLKQHIDSAIERGGDHSDADIEAALAADAKSS